MRLRLDLAYDGTDFVGWATQPGLRSVQGELETGLATVLRLADPPRVTVAGRTDAGVHARGQVAHVDLAETAFQALSGRTGAQPEQALLRRLAGVLAPDIVVFQVSRAAAGFDARFSAIWRRYSYVVVDDLAHRDPRRRGSQLWHPRPLDVPAMNLAAQGLLGEHDFLAFCKPRAGATTIRTLQHFQWERSRRAVVATVIADAFCHSMVRSLVGASLAVGEGRWPTDRPAELLAAVRRDSAIAVAPAHPLTLEHVEYPAVTELATRARTARSLRRLPAQS